jgi:hypothetical protein
MRSIHGENDRIVITVDSLNSKLETADKGGYLRGWTESRNQIRNALIALDDKKVAEELSKALKLTDS